MRAEVLVVGAGLAGCTLGLLLTRAGLDVLAVELGDAHAKCKLCGGALHVFSIASFDEVYGAGSFEGLGSYAAPALESRCLGAARRNACQFQTLPRERLDALCLARYEAAGGRLVDRARLVAIDAGRRRATFRSLRDGGTFDVEYGTLVGADGAGSAVRRILTGRRQRTCASVQGSVGRVGGDAILEYRPACQGYCWYLPHAEGATVGCMLHGEGGSACRGFLASFCESLGIEVPPLRGAPIPEGDDVLLRVGPDAYLVGDAAGLINPLDGGGMSYAIVSARLLAASLGGGTPYERAMATIASDIDRAFGRLHNAYFGTCLGIVAHTEAEESKHLSL